jgi:hypothetical protein
MTLSQEDWSAVSQMNGSELNERVFQIFQKTAREIQERDPDDPAVLGVVPRLASLLESRPELCGYREVFSLDHS